ncbi:Atxe2 family lasso peptide isopeptidase [Sphingobium phenoxybenzoativorans]|uniref:Atxe2 family lasso peptide isopeptidase n=1 Tax=Sphingobium phenoxybenzoativorans TaxID=1592790 RepID=UPI0008723503|nr:Atxe2 family lasso peptide isopeptidase [Sphingobium phenoxybenzoativorans]
MVTRQRHAAGRAHPLRAIVLLMAMAGSQPAIAHCSDLLPSQIAAVEHKRLITADDLIGLRDIGEPDPAQVDQPSPLALSPDGRRIAFLIRRAEPATNSYCIGLVVMGLDRRSDPRLIDSGGELMIATTVMRGMRMPVGVAEPSIPQWSPDGQSIAYLRRDKGRTQLWRARLDGSGAKAVTDAPVDVEAFLWSRNGHNLLFATRPATRALESAIDKEGEGGWHYDGRTAPHLGLRPQIAGAVPLQIESIDPDRGGVGRASAEETSFFGAFGQSSDFPQARMPNGRRAWVEPEGDTPLSPLNLHAQDSEGRDIVCRDSACQGGMIGLWWEKVGGTILFLRREGWARDTVALYRWTPGGQPRLLFRTSDLLTGCALRGDALLCLRENSVTPRHIVSVDVKNGKSRTLFDPNPEFRAIRLGSVERLRWKNDRGLAARGDLVLPPGHKKGERLPLIIVQYNSNGFLRGGTGDEYPVHLFAAQGFAVLSFERPASAAILAPGIKSWADFATANQKDWADRRSLLSALTVGAEMVIARGIADPERIGLTGLSDGASSTRFALINSRLFAAAAVSSCCTDTHTAMTYAGLAFADDQHEAGAPFASEGRDDYWRPYSLALNAKTMNRPLLMQLANEEALLGLESFTALHEQQQPVDLYIFPDEHHMKWQPAHRKAIYVRNLDWFSFWFQKRIDPDPAKAEQYQRWIQMREKRDETAQP